MKCGLIILVVTFLLFLDARFLMIGESYDSLEERIFRPLCKHNQQTIYLALVQYPAENGILPPDLKALVKAGFVEDESTYCPKQFNINRYECATSHFGNSNEVLLFEAVAAHGESDKRLNLKKIQPVVIFTTGDGRTIEQDSEIGTFKFSIGQ